MTKIDNDQVLRSLTADGAFRVITIMSTDTVQQAITAQRASGQTAVWLGELMTGAVLVREAMSPERRVQVLIKDALGRTQMVADANPRGWNRGIVNPGAHERPDMSHRAVLEVLYTLHNDVLQQGIVPFPGDSDVSTGLMTYMQVSEQITSVIAVCTLLADDGTVRAAGGYLVQLLPDAEWESLHDMTERLAAFTDLEGALADDQRSVEFLRSQLLGDLPCRDMARMFLSFGCNCDRQRFLTGLATLPDSDLEELALAGEGIEVGCDACGRIYRFSPGDLRGLRRIQN